MQGSDHTQVADKTIEADKKKLANRCINPNCRYTWSFGIIGPGTTIEIKCPKCKTVFPVIAV